MPRKASGRKSAAKSAGKNKPSAAERSAQRQTGKDIPDAPAGSEVEAKERKNSNPAHVAKSEETARLNRAAQNIPKENANGEADAKANAIPTTEELKKVQATQGPSGHPLGSVKAPKPNYKQATAKVQGQTKILRNKGAAPKPYDGPVVQPGGGGMPLKADSGEPIR